MKIHALARTAQATIGVALMQNYIPRCTARTGAEDIATKKAAAAANFLSGNSAHPADAEIDLSQVQSEARAWMRKNIEMRELVVQTLRVIAVAQSTGESDAEVSEDSLSIQSEFGRAATNTPDPLAYEAIVRRAIATLPHSAQVELMRLTKD